jgi:hypothetical protein
MKSFFNTLKFGVFLILNAMGNVALAADTKTNEVKLIKPVGGSILPGGQLYQSDIKSSFVFSKLIPFAIKYLIGLATALAVIAIMIGGYQYLTAYGDAEQHKKATKTITWAILGLILCITAYGIVAIISSINFSGATT